MRHNLNHTSYIEIHIQRIAGLQVMVYGSVTLRSWMSFLLVKMGLYIFVNPRGMVT